MTVEGLQSELTISLLGGEEYNYMMRLANLFLLLISLVTGESTCAEWRWRFRSDPDGAYRTRHELDSLVNLNKIWQEGDSIKGRPLVLRNAILDSVVLSAYGMIDSCDLSGASLRGADLRRLWFTRTNFDSCDLSYAKLDSALLMQCTLKDIVGPGLSAVGLDLTACNLNGSNLFSADFSHAQITGCKMTELWADSINLTNAVIWAGQLADSRLAFANMEGSNLDRVVMSRTKMPKARVGRTYFLPDSLPELWPLATAEGLRELQHGLDPSSLVRLREAFRIDGFRQQEREIVCALRRHGQSVLSYAFFDLPSEWGSNLRRPWNCLGIVTAVGWLIYFLFMLLAKKSGIYFLDALKNERPMSLNKSLLTADGLAYAIPIRKQASEFSRLWHRWTARLPVSIRLIWWSLYFSAIAATNFGFRDVNLGRLIRLMSTRDHELKPFGWVRPIFGLQSAICVYLLATWAVSLFGTPFE